MIKNLQILYETMQLQKKYRTLFTEMSQQLPVIDSKKLTASSAPQYAKEMFLARARAFPARKEYDREICQIYARYNMLTPEMVAQFEETWNEPYKNNEHQS